MKRAILIAVGLTFCGSAGADVIFNAADEFSASNNPNGVWTYGQAPTTSGAFSAYLAHGALDGVAFWDTTGTGPTFDLPGVFHNGSGAAIPNWVTTVNMPLNAVMLHPGADGQLSVIRFTAPADGVYDYSAGFEALARDGGGTSTDVHLFKNGVQVFGADFGGAGGGMPLGSTLSSGLFSAFLLASETLEVRVGRGTNGTYYSDSTGVAFAVTQVAVVSEAVPLPSAACAVVALLGLGLMRYRPRRKVVTV